MAKTENNEHLSGRIQEAVQWQAKPVEVVLEDNGETTILKNVLILGRASKNLRDYLPQSTKEGHRLFESVNAFDNHRDNRSDQSLSTNIGVIRNPHDEPEGVRADHAMPTADPLTARLVWRAKHAPKNIGYSPDHDCSWDVVGGRQKIHTINRVSSVDVVMRPGTTGGLRENEEDMPIEQKDFAEHGLSAVDNCRSIIVDSTASLPEKRKRLLEALNEFHGELLEGEIGDEMAKSEPMHKMRRLRDIASNKMDEAMWSHEYPMPHDKMKRQLAVMADHAKELKAMKCNCKDCSSGRTKEQENPEMTPEEITVDWLKTNKPEVVAKLTGTDEHTRLTEQVKTLTAANAEKDAEIQKIKDFEAGRIKESEIAAEIKAAGIDISGDESKKGLFGRLKEQLSSAADKASRATILRDYAPAFKGRVTEAAFAGPMEDLSGSTANDGKPVSQYEATFGKRR
jgi:hypothetical protein